MLDLTKYYKAIENADSIKVVGKVIKVIGLVIEAQVQGVSVGELCSIELDAKNEVLAEVAGFKEGRVLLMPLGTTAGIKPGSKICATGAPIQVKVGPQLLGRILNGLGEPIDQKAIDGLLTIGRGQRIGIFSGSGVGKSTLMGMLARNCEADINVISLIGERGREVKDFIEESLGEEGLKKSVVICATSDSPPLIRMKGALVGTTIAEYFRDQGKNVLFMMDSVTRFAMAQREIGLATGEPPTTKGYTPSVFALLPKLMERAGTSKKGIITAIYTVLVEGSDMDEPIADTSRSILDGHMVLTRELASRNHYPSIDINHSISRLFTAVTSDEHKKIAAQLREVLAKYKEAEDLINIGAYVQGSNPKIDYAIEKIDAINSFLTQGINDKISFEETIKQLKEIFET
jgi:flagellum-specific ATP synthase